MDEEEVSSDDMKKAIETIMDYVAKEHGGAHFGDMDAEGETVEDGDESPKADLEMNEDVSNSPMRDGAKKVQSEDESLMDDLGDSLGDQLDEEEDDGRITDIFPLKSMMGKMGKK